jgi:GT2 family glycosyltransferase
MGMPAVVIPVFNALPRLRECLSSVARYSADAEILLIDDASTDPGVRPLLEQWVQDAPQQRGLLVNDRNRGFVHSANRGMRHFKGDVVLLNSDTLVTPRWLELLGRCLASDRRIASATPWSNNGEIVSFPDICRAGPVPPEPAALAEVIRACGPPQYPEIPTAVGFCMAISRTAIEAIGYFDAEAFGRGYGEENDFSLRAAAAGLKNVLCDDAYVAHHGGASFGPLGLAPDSGSMQRLLDRHPGYRELIEDYIRRDPLAQRRSGILDAIRVLESPG